MDGMGMGDILHIYTSVQLYVSPFSILTFSKVIRQDGEDGGKKKKTIQKGTSHHDHDKK